MFHDTAPQHRLPEPTRAECDAADEAHAQQRAAVRGAACFALTDDLARLLDRYDSAWQADDQPLIEQIFNNLAEALALAERLS